MYIYIKGREKVGRNSLFLVLPMLIAFLLAGFSGCKGEDEEILEKLRPFERMTYEEEQVSEQRIEELKEGIEKYEQIVEREVEAAAQIGEYYKMLAVAYIDREMYGRALENLEEAIDYYPENSLIFYLAGVCSARMAKAAVNRPAEQEELFKEAENYYLRAIFLDNDFVEALYGLSVLYVFELDRVVDAEPYLERILEKESRNTQAMFLLARVYVYSGRVEDAVELYEEIIDKAQSRQEKERARDMKNQVLEGAYG
jgi:tetratricopeptide (TPR) repeat protein